MASQVALVVKKLPANAGDTRDLSLILGLKRSLEKDMATHSSILAWGNPMDRGAWRATVYSITKSQTGLKRPNIRTHGMLQCTRQNYSHFIAATQRR